MIKKIMFSLVVLMCTLPLQAEVIFRSKSQRSFFVEYLDFEVKTFISKECLPGAQVEVPLESFASGQVLLAKDGQWIEITQDFATAFGEDGAVFTVQMTTGGPLAMFIEKVDVGLVSILWPQVV